MAGEPVPGRGRRRLVAAMQAAVPFGCLLIVPLIVRCTIGRRDAFVRQWASEALNLHILWAATMLLVDPNEATGWAYVGFVIYWTVGVAYICTVSVMGALKASRGELWRYPVNLRLVDRG